MLIELPDERIRFDGAVAVQARPGRVTTHRIDRHWAHQLPIETTFVEGMPSGVRLVFATDADTVTVRCTPMRLTVGITPLPATFDLVADGRLISSADADFGHVVTVDLATGAREFSRGEPGDVVLAGIPDGTTTVEVWLPQSAGLDLHSLGLPDGATLRAAPVVDRKRWVHHGSSISHCMEAAGPSRTWPAIAAAATGCDLVNLGLAGQCQIDQFTARTIRDLDADRISLKLGINVANGDTMTERTFVSAVHGFLDTIRDGHPDTPMLVISPIICPALEHTPGPSLLGDDGHIVAQGDPADAVLGRLSVGHMRTLLAEIVGTRQSFGDEHLFSLDGRKLFGEDDVDDLPDGLHPNAVGYERIGRRFAEHPFLNWDVDALRVSRARFSGEPE